ncbi:ATPase involved in DNA repair [Microbacterium esteraromaticum]|uniref:ATPase involved in DNA repair n=2 Tax=Microbacterium esteraromaticum TaxID=57043 RepID=A0A1R4ISJ7_9MICO|nr:ATPase involved in DNA repair [Microbacterium esteraromaticum]
MSADDNVPTPTPPVPTPPVPGPPRTPVPMPRIAAAPAASPAVTAPISSDAAKWGRVTEDGTVEVLEGETWRAVGQYPDGTADEALAYFARKFDDLSIKLGTLETRTQGGGASASDLTKQATHLRGELTDAAAVGDLAGLRARVDALLESLSEATAKENEAAKEALAAAVAERTAIVEKAEAVAARDLAKVQWKQVTVEMTELFDAWQAHQQNGPRLPKGTAQQLWKRFRDARSVVDKARRAFFSDLDETHRAARDAKSRLVERAEALAPRGVDGIPAYRNMLDEWKASGRAGRKADDALWAKFKAAGDELYAARAEQSAAEEADSAPRIEAREALLVEAKAVADESNLKRARALLTRIQRQWDEVGRIFPRDKERALDDRMRSIEQGLKSREEVDWKKNNPETKARVGDMSSQLHDVIEKLESELASAEKAGNKKAIAEATEALSARRAWLSALGG